VGFLQIQIKYFNKLMPRIEKIAKGDWLDLRAAEEVEMKAGEYKLIPLGFACKLPAGYEAYIAPRGSTFSKYGITVANSVGVVDETFCGNDDQWFLSAIAHRDTLIPQYERVCQFRIQQKMPSVDLVEVSDLTDPNRGSHGSTGHN
jgi:dUTP pyrophosphatase